MAAYLEIKFLSPAYEGETYLKMVDIRTDGRMTTDNRAIGKVLG